MKTNKQKSTKKTLLVNTAFVEKLGEVGWTYIKTVVDVLREPILILDSNLRVMAANESFYNTFQVSKTDTEGKIIYKLGNGQWNIPTLKKLLEDILPKHTFFKGFEVAHKFPSIGDKVMILNARQIYCKEDLNFKPCPPIILLAIEDITEMMTVAQKLADHTTAFEKKVTEKTYELEAQISELQNQIKNLKRL